MYLDFAFVLVCLFALSVFFVCLPCLFFCLFVCLFLFNVYSVGTLYLQFMQLLLLIGCSRLLN